MITVSPLGAVGTVVAGDVPPAPQGPADMLAALREATEGAPVAKREFNIPTPEEARVLAEERLFERLTPERLADTLDRLTRGEEVEYLDLIGAGVILRHASPENAATPLGARALEALKAATDLRIAASPRLEAVPVETQLGVNELGLPNTAIPMAALTKFGAPTVLGAVDRVLRVDDLVISRSKVFDYSSVVTQAQSSYVSDEFRNDFVYYFSNWYFTYSYYYYLYERFTASHSYYDEVVRTLYKYAYFFDRWQMTSGVSMALVDMAAPLPTGTTAHVLYALVTPYSYVDHWWVIYTLDVLTYNIYHSESHYYSRYWSESTSDWYLQGSSSSSFSYTYTVGFRFTSFTSRGGYERIPVRNLPLVSSPVIKIQLPLGEYVPIYRQDNFVDVTTAASVSLPGQIGVEYKDRKASAHLVTTPMFTDLNVVADENPVANKALREVDTVAFTVAAAQANPQGFANGKVAEANAIIAPVRSNPQGYATGTVASLCPKGPTDPKACSTPPVPFTMDRPVWLEAVYAADFSKSWKSGGAGLGFFAFDGRFPIDGKPIYATIEGAGLGAPVGFSVDRDGANLIATPLVFPGSLPPAPPAPGVPDSAVPIGDGGDGTLDAILEMPYEVSFPAYLDAVGISSGKISELDFAKRQVLSHMTASKLAATLEGMMNAETEDKAIPYADVLEASVLIYYAGPGYAEDTVFGDAARSALAAALGELLGATAVPAAVNPCPATPTVPPPVPPAVPPAPTPASVQACATKTANDVKNSLTDVRLNLLKLLQFDGTILGQDTSIVESEWLSDHSRLYENVATSITKYVAIYESVIRYETWIRYTDALFRYNQNYGESLSYYGTYQRLVNYRYYYDRVDFLTGVTTAILGIGNETLQGHLGANAVYATVLPFAINNRWWIDVLFNSYQFDFLSAQGSWGYYYQYQVLNGRVSASYLPYGSYRPLGFSHYSTGFSVNGRPEVLAFPNLNVAGGASIKFFVPASTYAVLAKTPAPFVTGGLAPGIVPFQDLTDRQSRFWADNLVLGPIPNALKIRVDDDPTLEKPMETVGELEADAIKTQGDASILADALTHDPTGTATKNADAVKAAATKAADDARNGATKAVADAQKATAPIVANPLGWARAQPAELKKTTVTVPTAQVPKEVDESVYYEVSFTAAGFGSLRPVITYVGVLAPKDKGLADQRDVVIQVTGQGIEGGGPLGAQGPFEIRHSVSVRGSDLAPDFVGGQSVTPLAALPPTPIVEVVL